MNESDLIETPDCFVFRTFSPSVAPFYPAPLRVASFFSELLGAHATQSARLLARLADCSSKLDPDEMCLYTGRGSRVLSTVVLVREVPPDFLEDIRRFLASPLCSVRVGGVCGTCVIHLTLLRLSVRFYLSRRVASGLEVDALNDIEQPLSAQELDILFVRVRGMAGVHHSLLHDLLWRYIFRPDFADQAQRLGVEAAIKGLTLKYEIPAPPPLHPDPWVALGEFLGVDPESDRFQLNYLIGMLDPALLRAIYSKSVKKASFSDTDDRHLCCFGT